MIQELLQRILKGAIPVREDESAVEQAKWALDEAKARRERLDRDDPRRLADLEIQQRQAELTQAEYNTMLTIYRQHQDHANRLVAEYQQAASAFDERLAALLGVVTEMSRLTRQIEEIRAELWRMSRPLGLVDTGIEFRARDWFAQVVGRVQRAWRQGQQS
jgi:DNA repair exonuclease SbcCD ATPase subunit